MIMPSRALSDTSRSCNVTRTVTYAGSLRSGGMPNKRLAQSKLVRMVLNKGEALA